MDRTQDPDLAAHVFLPHIVVAIAATVLFLAAPPGALKLGVG